MTYKRQIRGSRGRRSSRCMKPGEPGFGDVFHYGLVEVAQHAVRWWGGGEGHGGHGANCKA